MDRHVGSGSNHERLNDGYAGVKRTFYENLNLLLTRNGIKASEIQDVVAGLSGADNDMQTERLQEILRGFGFQCVMVCNDGICLLRQNATSELLTIVERAFAVRRLIQKEK